MQGATFEESVEDWDAQITKLFHDWLRDCYSTYVLIYRKLTGSDWPIAKEECERRALRAPASNDDKSDTEDKENADSTAPTTTAKTAATEKKRPRAKKALASTSVQEVDGSDDDAKNVTWQKGCCSSRQTVLTAISRTHSAKSAENPRMR